MGLFLLASLPFVYLFYLRVHKSVIADPPGQTSNVLADVYIRSSRRLFSNAIDSVRTLVEKCLLVRHSGALAFTAKVSQHQRKDSI